MKKMYRFASLVTVALFAAVASAVPVTDGLIIHLDARSLIGLKEGDPVSQWPDSALADTVDGTVKAAANAALPTFKGNAHNGIPAVHFDDVAKQALMSDLWTWDQTQGVTVIIFCTGGEANTDRVVHVGDVGGAGYKTFGCDVSSDQSGLTDTGSGARYNNGWCCTATAGPNPVRQGVWHTSVRQIAQAGRYDSLIYAVDNFPALKVTSNQPSRTIYFDASGNVVTVGNGRQNTTSGWVGGTDWYYGDVSDVLVYNKLLDQSQMQEVMDYLKNKYLYGAHTPSPAHNDINQGTIVGNKVEVAFSWDTGLDPNSLSVPNADITDHYFYLAANEPNFKYITPVAISAGSPTQATGSYGPVELNMDKTYYWRVDESVNGSGPGDPNTIMGPVWSFETIKALPIINEHPVGQAVFPGETATFTIAVSSLSDETYYWYKSADGANDTPDDDISVGTDDDSLIISSAQASDEGYYFCEVKNGGGEALSNVVILGIKRKVAHWTLDQSDLVGGLYLDSSGQGHHADPNLVPAPSQFVAGVNPTKTNEGLDLKVEPLTAAWTESWAPAFGTGQVTVSAWVNWSGLATWPWQGLVNSRGSTIDPEGDVRNFLLEIRPTGILQVNAAGYALQSTTLPIDQWAHVAVSAGADGLAIYIDGMPVAAQTPGGAIPQNIVPLYLGALSRNVSGPINTFNGIMDDVRIYNYAKDQFEVADLYYEITETPVCLNPDGVVLKFDVAGGGPEGDKPDCMVNLVDVAAFVTDWLNCGLYPQEDCP